MNENEEKIMKIIIQYYKKNQSMPTRRFIQKKLKYISVSSITQYFKSLENKGYLVRDSLNRIIINNYVITDYNVKRIKVLNLQNEYLNIILNKKKNYLGYRLNNNYFENQGILKNDFLIIEKDKKLNIGDFGLFIINSKYRIMKYNYKDGFYLLEDNEILILNHVNSLGKVIQIIRKI